jgi:hypothetical protein
MQCWRFSSRLSAVGLVAVATIVVTCGAARADEAPATAMAPATEATSTSSTSSPPATETLPAAALTETATRAPNVSYGVAIRGRWVSVPKWMLNLFTARNMPLSSYSYAAEFMRRKGEFDMIFALGYQGMGPPDGNWLGKNSNPAVETDFVQFRNFGMVTLDAAFVWHSFLNDWFGLHYGAGLGLGIVTGNMLRTSNDGCTAANAGDLEQCHPQGVTCDNVRGCDEGQLADTMNNTGMDQPNNPRRFADPNVPPVVPIVNVVVGLDFRLPRVRGWEAKVEGGFYNAFFLGGGVGYTF